MAKKKFVDPSGHDAATWLFHRRGLLITAHPTPDQCNTAESKQFEYRVDMILPDVLDSRGYLVDHNDVDKVIQDLNIAGSCEYLARMVDMAVRNYMVTQDHTSVLASRVSVRPAGAARAYFDHISYKVGYEHLFPLFNSHGAH